MAGSERLKHSLAEHEAGCACAICKPEQNRSPLAFAQLVLVAVGVLGLVYSVLGGGRGLMDYAVGAAVLFADGFAITMAVIALGWALDSVVQFFNARKNRAR